MDVSSTDLGLKFRTAASTGDIETLNNIYAQAPELINASGLKSGCTALHQAARNNQLETVKWLLKHQANPNLVDNQGNNALQQAVLTISLETAHHFMTKVKEIDFLHVNNEQKNCSMIIHACLNNSAISDESKPHLVMLIKPFKKSVVNQVKRMQQSGHEIQALRLHEDGRIEIRKTAEFTSRELRGKNIKVAYEDNDGVLREQSLVVDRQINIDKAPDSFRLTPLVFLMKHIDNTTFEIIQNDFEFLKVLGYKGLLFEYNESESIDAPIDNMHPSMQVNIDFLRQVKEQNWLNYHGIDADLPSVVRTQGFVLTDELNMVREKAMAKNIAKYAKQYDGGVIIVMGAAHYSVAKKLFSTLGSAFSHVHYIPAYQFNSKELLFSLSDLETELLFKTLISDGLTTVLKKETEQDMPALGEKFRMAVREGLCQIASKETYQEEVSSTSALDFLKSVTPQFVKFRGMLKTQTYQLDACLPVNDPDEFKTQAGLLARETGIQALPCYIKSNIDSGSKVNLHLKVEDINGVGSINREMLENRYKK